MLDTEEKQVLDQANKRRDLEELREQKQIDGHLGPMEQKFIDDFNAVTSSMEKAMRDVPDLHFSKDLDSPEYYALKSLYMAKTGRSIDTDEYISGLERDRLLNQALIYLQPVLSLALRPDFREGRVIYDKLVSQVTEIGEDIKAAIAKEAIPPRRRTSQAKTEEEDNDGNDSADDESDDASADESADAEDDGADDKAEASGRKRSLWSRLTGKKPSPDQGEDTSEDQDDNDQGSA